MLTAQESCNVATMLRCDDQRRLGVSSVDEVHETVVWVVDVVFQDTHFTDIPVLNMYVYQHNQACMHKTGADCVSTSPCVLVLEYWKLLTQQQLKHQSKANEWAT